ncbi:MAG: ATP-grasp domain-containing protein [Pseudomonadota bacterium]
MQELILITHVPTPSVNEGFLPAARALGLPVVLLTDHAEAHRQHFSQPGLNAYPNEIQPCDVFNPVAVIDAVSRRKRRPAAIFSNSDHLQTSTAIAADYFGLPGKDWRVCYRAKNKAEMRAYLQSQSIDTVWHAQAWDQASLAQVAGAAPFPCILKPREGVASQQVFMAHDRAELEAHCQTIWKGRPGQVLLIEEFLDGPLYTLETLGSGRQIHVLGGFRVTLSPPPHFIELEARWGTGLGCDEERAVLEQITRFGVGFGACHTEFVLTPAGPRLIEINYRSIGDHRDFLMQEALGMPYFETVLRLHLGESLALAQGSSKAAAIRYFVAQQAGKVVKAPAPFFRSELETLLSYVPLRSAGETVSLSRSNKDYLGILRGVGRSAAAVEEAMHRASAELHWELQP